MKDKIIIFGTGSVAEYIIKKIDCTKVDILAFCNEDDSFEMFHGINCIRPYEVSNYQYDYILIASGYVNAIADKLKKIGVNSSNIVAYIFDEAETYHEMAGELNEYLNATFNRGILKKWIYTNERLCEFYPSIMWDENMMVTKVEKDFVREETVKLISEMAKVRQCDGNVAELGVYRGDFTVVIDQYFKDRKFYLFDTFDGFDTEDLNSDLSISNIEGERKKFKDTSVELVLGRLKNPERIIIKKGVFPESFDIDDKFVFVSIDLNLESPVKEALNIFYPRLVKGGYILVSDYYAPFYEGTRKAVDEWCLHNDEYPIPIADFYGSVLIQKR